MSTSSRTPTLTEAVTRAIDIRLAALFSSRVAVVQKYDAANQFVDVQPQLKETYEDATGEPSVASLPVITNVPVYFPGGGDFMMTMPLQQGDEVLLVFSDRSMDLWKENGGEVDPVALQRHALTDAVAFVGVRSKPNRLQEVDTSRAVFGKTGGVRIAVDDLVHLGVDHNEAAPNFVALANLVKQEISAVHDTLQSLVTTFNSHTHIVSTTGSAVAQTGTAAPTTSAATPPNPVQAVAATKVKAK